MSGGFYLIILTSNMKYFINWRILPERTYVRISKVDLALPGFGKVLFSADAAQINMIIDTDNTDEATVYIIAKNIATTIVTNFGFAMGCAYSIEIISITNDSTLSPNVYGVQILPLKEQDHEKFLNKILPLSLSDVYLNFAIIDITKAINNEIECGFLCYRAIETIKSRFKLEDLKNDGRDKMHSELGTEIDKNDIFYIKDFADSIRHWSYYSFKPTTWQEREKILLITKKIIDKYIDYLSK